MTQSTAVRKKFMIEALYKQLGIVSAACKEVGISRETHYKWLHKDIKYKQKVEAVQDYILDFGENALFKLIDSGNPSAIIFFNKTKGKDRGYVEKTEVDMNTTVKADLHINELLKDIKDGEGI